MKKIMLLVALVFHIVCFSTCYANSFNMSDNDILELFDAISFDYVQLTNTDLDSAKEDLKTILEEDYISSYESMYSDCSVEECLYDAVINYQSFIKKVTFTDKKEYNCFILKKVFEYYDNNEKAKESIIANHKLLQQVKQRKVTTLNNDGESRSTIVGILYINSDAGNNFTHASSIGSTQGAVGHHAWLTFKNVTNTTQPFGGCIVGAYNSYTVGTWQSSTHDGIFYNYESYYNDLGEFDSENSSYLAIAVTETDLAIINDYITDSSNDCWYAWQNCVNFSEGVWNSIASSANQISGGIGPIKTPKLLKSNIDTKSMCSSGYVIPASGNGYYYRGANPIIFIPG